MIQSYEKIGLALDLNPSREVLFSKTSQKTMPRQPVLMFQLSKRFPNYFLALGLEENLSAHYFLISTSRKSHCSELNIDYLEDVFLQEDSNDTTLLKKKKLETDLFELLQNDTNNGNSNQTINRVSKKNTKEDDQEAGSEQIPLVLTPEAQFLASLSSQCLKKLQN